mmetsp:Transcript_13114/g.27773  ORF Transcript_13114/g.27773 Transcript_13114/m.27773 type:complete len:115 (+) Transcript_13114:573-917(+)
MFLVLPLDASCIRRAATTRSCNAATGSTPLPVVTLDRGLILLATATRPAAAAAASWGDDGAADDDAAEAAAADWEDGASAIVLLSLRARGVLVLHVRSRLGECRRFQDGWCRKK